jgi:hypothetical protein
MSILLKCSSRTHTLRLNPKRFWKRTLCPQCKVPVDPLRLRRVMKLPSLVFDKDFNIFPAYITRTVIPIVGFIALVVGLSLSIVNWRKSDNGSSASNPPQSITDEKSNGLVTSNPISDSPKNSNSTASTTPASPQDHVGPTNSSVNAAAQETANMTLAVSPTPIPPTVRYTTGTNLIRPQSAGGHGSLKISNGTNSDAVAKLVDIATNKTCRLVFIQSSAVGTINNISSGNYTLKFSLGSNYDSVWDRITTRKVANSYTANLFQNLMKYWISVCLERVGAYSGWIMRLR